MKINIKKKNWQLIKLGEVLKKTEDNDKENAKNRYQKFLKVEHLDAKCLHVKRWGEHGKEELPPTFFKIFKKGQILFPTRNPHLKRAAFVHFDGICGEKTLTLDPMDLLVDPKFIPFLFHSKKFYDHSTSAIIGSTNPHVRWRDIAEFEFLLPPKEEQAKLAKLLWAADNVVEKDKALLEKLEVVNLITNRNFFNIKNGKQVELSEISHIIMGQSPPGESYNENENGKPFLQGSAEFGETHPRSYKYTTEAKKIVPTNSILISVRAPVGDLNISDKEYCIGRGLAALVIQDSDLREYIFEFLSYSRIELEKNSTGSTFKSINKDILHSLSVHLPDNKEIKNCVKVFKQMKKNKYVSNSKLQSSQALLKSLINEVFQ